MDNKQVNGGALFSIATKTNVKGPDYRGDITVDIRTLEVNDNLATIKLAGWKKVSKAGKTYLSLAVDLYKKEEEQANDFE